jgi:site-specific DNA recombinase
MKNAVAYMRVSTNGQVGEDKFGLDSQRDQIEVYARANKINVTHWYVESGVSGVKEERPELDKILYGEEVDNPPTQMVIVAKSDRLSRDINLYFYYKFTLKKKGIELVSVQEEFGSMGAFASVLEALTMCIAEQERLNIAKRTGAGRKVKAKAGGYSGGRAPFGYRVENGRLVLVPEEADVVRRIFVMRAEGQTMMTIAETLNEEGHRARTGNRFYTSHVQSILDNKMTYRGFYKYGESMEWVKGIHEPILSGKEWE